MARPDFIQKWAGSRPSIPAISAPDYALGFAAYLGSQPPTTDDHDFIMNLQDERAIWLAGALESTRVDIASAATINLTTAAPDVRDIRITGAATITGFTVEAGRVYRAVFSGAATLTNNAAIVTNTGANVTVAAGTSCTIRSTAANTVEILELSRSDLIAVIGNAAAGRVEFKISTGVFAFQWASFTIAATSAQGIYFVGSASPTFAVPFTTVFGVIPAILNTPNALDSITHTALTNSGFTAVGTVSNEAAQAPACRYLAWGLI
jgi:hypothetical protein